MRGDSSMRPPTAAQILHLDARRALCGVAATRSSTVPLPLASGLRMNGLYSRIGSRQAFSCLAGTSCCILLARSSDQLHGSHTGGTAVPTRSTDSEQDAEVAG
eukprot:COSAG01_NODE_2921_length_6846_cov_4.205276_1_plen_102_part_10